MVQPHIQMPVVEQRQFHEEKESLKVGRLVRKGVKNEDKRPLKGKLRVMEEEVGPNGVRW